MMLGAHALRIKQQKDAERKEQERKDHAKELHKAAKYPWKGGLGETMRELYRYIMSLLPIHSDALAKQLNPFSANGELLHPELQEIVPIQSMIFPSLARNYIQ
jgi:hypothetical protein